MATQPLPVFTQLIPFSFDSIYVTYTGLNATTIVYKTGGISGLVVATLVLTYDGNNNVLTVERS